MPGGAYTLFFDTETFSDVPIKRGHHAYFDSPQAQVLVATWAVDDGPVQIEDLTTAYPDGRVEVAQPSDTLVEHLMFADEVVIHGSPFDRTAIRRCWGIDLAVERVFDTMACAMAHSLPGGLGKLCEIMRVPEDEGKDEEGRALIRLFTMPRPKNTKLRRANKITHPAEWSWFLAYAGSDIRAMRSIRKTMPTWNYQNSNQHRELDLWRLDQRINDRGFRVDLDLAKKAIGTINREQKRLAAETQELTGYDKETGEGVDKASRRDELLTHIFIEYGVNLPDLKKDTLERRLEDPEIPDVLKQLLRVRLATSTTSTAKYSALTRVVVEESPNVHVIRGALAFCGALRTGRWAGRLFQPHNLPRPRPWFHEPEQAAAIEALMADALDIVDDEPMRTLGDLLRGVIIARPGYRLFSSDLANIEGRTAAWLTGEQWKLDAFAEIDKAKAEGRKVADMYQRAFAKMFGVEPLTVVGDDRQVGKVSELANGYEGGVAAWLAFAIVYRLKLETLGEVAYDRLPRKARDQAEIIWDWRQKKGLTTFGLDRRTFVVLEAFKTLWREGHPATSSYWPELGAAAMEAVRYPKKEIAARKLVFERRGNWLRLVLPSGRVLSYPGPNIRQVGGKDQLTYLGVNQYTRQWSRLATYGGKLFENANQAVARDVMAENMPAIEAAGWRILLTVHDDVIAEAPAEAGLTADRLSAILANNPPWLRGCPLAAGGFEADRYRKD
jgi:DNA polymerase